MDNEGNEGKKDNNEQEREDNENFDKSGYIEVGKKLDNVESSDGEFEIGYHIFDGKTISQSLFNLK